MPGCCNRWPSASTWLSKRSSVGSKPERHPALPASRGRAKTLTIRRIATDKWYARFSVEYEPERLPDTPAQLEIDVGLAHFATRSAGTVIENPRFFRQEERALARMQRKRAKRERGSPQRRRHRKAVARDHERIAFRRKSFARQHSRRIVSTYGFICGHRQLMPLEQRVFACPCCQAPWTGI